MALYGISSLHGRLLTKDNKIFLILFGIMCAVFVTLINTTKVPENDLEWYVDRYKLAKQMSLFKFVLIASNQTITESYKEPLYGVLVWILNRLYDGNVTLFKFSISFIEYGFFVTSVYLFGRILKMRLSYIIFGMFMFCFFPYIFTTSLHLLRQFIATSLLFFVIVRISFYSKYDWWALISMVLIHSTSALFVPLLLLPAFDKPFVKAKIWYVGSIVSLLAIRILAGYIFEVGGFSQNDSIGYVLDRARHETTYELDFAFSKIIMDAIVLLYCLYLFFSNYCEKYKGMRRFSFIFIFLSIFVLANLHQVQLAARFTSYIIPALPFLFMFFFRSINMNKILLLAFCFLLLLFFSIYIYTGTWTYKVEYAGLFTPVFSYM